MKRFMHAIVCILAKISKDWLVSRVPGCSWPEPGAACPDSRISFVTRIRYLALRDKSVPNLSVEAKIAIHFPWLFLGRSLHQGVAHTRPMTPATAMTPPPQACNPTESFSSQRVNGMATRGVVATMGSTTPPGCSDRAH